MTAVRSAGRAGMLLIAALALAGTSVLAGCGGSDSVEASKLALSIVEQGKQASFDVPKSAKGGLVDLSLTNKGKAPHQAQLILIEGNHTTQDVLKAVGSNSNKTPDWIRAEGGTTTIPPGQTGTTTLQLPAGNYLVADLGAASSSGPPAYATFKLTEGDEGDLPDTDATVTAAEVGKEEFKWEGLDGLKAGKNTITFDSKGDDTLHHIIAAPVKGDQTVAELKKALASPGPPPFDLAHLSDTAVLDSGKSAVTTLDLQPGRYAFVCFLSDRDGGKSHDQEGLLAVQDIPK